MRSSEDLLVSFVVLLGFAKANTSLLRAEKEGADSTVLSRPTNLANHDLYLLEKGILRLVLV